MEHIFQSLPMSVIARVGRAISDFQKACDLGYELGCENLQGALGER